MKNVLELLRKLQLCGIRLRLDDSNNLLIRGNKESLGQDLVDEIKSHKSDLVEYLLQSRHLNIEVRKNRDGEVLPVSFAQRRLWLLDKIDGGSTQYNMSCPLTLTGMLDVDVMNRAFEAIIERHESLRTCFAVGNDGQPVQVIQEAKRFRVSKIDISEMGEAERHQQLRQIMREESRRSFDLNKDTMLRALLIKLDEEEHIALVTVHHIASDGWSISILINEFSSLYESFVQGNESPLAPLPIQYADFAIWQRNWLQGNVLKQQMGYWEKQLADIPVVHALQTDYPRPSIQEFRGKSYSSRIDGARSTALSRLCESQGATLFMGLQAAFAALLSRHSNENDIVIGTPIANREQAEVAGLIGFFANTLVLRSELSGDPTFIELLQRSKRMLLDAYAHQQVPFEEIVERLQPKRSDSHSPLFQVMLILQNNEQGVLKLPGLSLGSIELDSETAKYDITLDVTETEQGLVLSWEYNVDLFRETTIARMATHFETLLRECLAQPAQSISKAAMLSEDELNQLVVQRNETAKEYPQDACIHQLFEKQVEANPTAIAVIYEDQQLTYSELNERANRLAHYLSNEIRVLPGALVGIYLERSLEAVVGILAVLKIAGTYVPIDPESPDARVAYVIEDAKPSAVLTNTHLREKLPTSETQAICLDDKDLRKQLRAQASQNPQASTLGLTSGHVAYVIYTSGSTGNPKGVLAPHRSIVNRVSWLEQEFPSKKDEVFCQKTAFSFVDHVAELFQALSYGRSVVVVPTNDTLDSEKFIDIVERHKVTRLTVVPSLLRAMIEQGTLAAMSSLRLVVSSGEVLQVEDARRFRQILPSTALLNFYGSSEVGADVTYYLYPQDGAIGSKLVGDVGPLLSVPIGKPIANTEVFVLDGNGSLSPQGVAGELHIGGLGLSNGYLNKDELSAEKFVMNPFYNKEKLSSTEYLYKTGDIVRWLPDGNLEYMGRQDYQVKVRGYRIELGEIETALMLHPRIKDAVVSVIERVPGDKQLQGYIVPRLPDDKCEDVATLSLFYFGADTDSPDTKYELYLKAAKYADEHGFEAVWTPERHFDTVGGFYPNPSLLSAALATTTKQIKLRAGSVVLPFHDPIRVAEEWSVVDNLSNGRVGIGATAGWHVRDFVLAPESYEGRKQLLKEGLETLQNLWQGKKIQRKDGKGSDVEIRVYPQPIQEKLPIWITAAGNPATFVEAGRLGANLLTNLLGQSIDELTESIALYKKSLVDNGHDPKQGRVTLMIHTYLGQDLQQTMDEAREPFKKYMRSHIALIIPMLRSLNVPTDDLAEEDLENMVDFAFERYAQAASFIGTPESVLAVAARLRNSGVDEFACLIDWMDSSSALEGLDSLRELRRIARLLPPSPAALSEYCRGLMPQYMVPSGYTFLDKLPLTPSGKVDRKVLPEPDNLPRKKSYVAPRSETEDQLCVIWQEVLGVEQVGVLDNFFELGGSSLSATRLIGRINQIFKVQIEIKALFQCEDLAALSDMLIERRVLDRIKNSLEENTSKEEIEW